MLIVIVKEMDQTGSVWTDVEGWLAPENEEHMVMAGWGGQVAGEALTSWWKESCGKLEEEEEEDHGGILVCIASEKNILYLEAGVKH